MPDQDKIYTQRQRYHSQICAFLEPCNQATSGETPPADIALTYRPPQRHHAPLSSLPAKQVNQPRRHCRYAAAAVYPRSQAQQARLQE